MAKKKKAQGLIDKLVHGDKGDQPDAAEHELEGEDAEELEADLERDEENAEEFEPAAEHELEGDKHQHKKFDKFKRGN